MSTPTSPSLSILESFLKDQTSIPSSSVAPIVRTLYIGPFFDPIKCFRAVRRGDDSFCFVSTNGSEVTTTIGTEPLHVVRTRSDEQPITSTSTFLSDTVIQDPLSTLQSLTKKYHIPDEFRHEVSQLNGIAFGFVGFDAVRQFEPKLRTVGNQPKDVLQIPEAVLMVCTSLIVVTGQSMHIMALCPLEMKNLHEGYAAALARIDELESRISSPIVSLRVRDFDGEPSGGIGVSNAGGDGREGYCNHVSFLQSRIAAGDMVQTVPSHRIEIKTPSHPLNVWRSLRQVSPSKYSFYVECKHDVVLIGASPELLVSVRGGQVVETHPIAGTRSRGVDSAEDERLKADLLSDEKERAEHIMLVDLGRNDLNRICKPESVHVPRLMQVDLFSHVMHIVSVVRGELREDRTSLDAFRSVFPAGTVSGAPKIMAIEHIYNLEKERRGVYAGAVGFFELSGRNTETCIAIRTILFLGTGVNQKCYLQAGGGIVLDSNSEAEYQETIQKMSAPLAAIKAAENTLLQSGPLAMASASSIVSAEHNKFFIAAIEASNYSDSDIIISSNTDEQDAARQRSLMPATPTRSFVRGALVSDKKGSILLIDNYDSFTYNLYQLLARFGKVTVVRNDKISVEEAKDLEPSHLVLGPGPCSPSEAGICNSLLAAFQGVIPILGVCLGSEVIVEHFGGKIDVCSEIKHGKTSSLLHDGSGVFSGVAQGVTAVRYHSLAAFPEDLKQNAPTLEVTSSAEDSHIIMGVRHKKFAIEGVQFHPESILTDQGEKMVSNFISWKTGLWPQGHAPSSILQQIVDSRRIDIKRAKEITSEETLRSMITQFSAPISLLERIVEQRPDVAIVAEIKRASPSKGMIAKDANASHLAKSFAACGVAGISVLTEPTYFKGSLEDLALSRREVELESIECKRPRPAFLRKDFIIDEYQLFEAAAHGADSVLLIVAILTEAQLLSLLTSSRKLGMEPLVEVADEYELERALRVGAHLIGVNARDLHTFVVSTEAACRVIQAGRAISDSKKSPIVFVGLSGVKSHKDMNSYHRSGAHAALVGEHLMRVRSVPRAIANLLGKPATPLIKICGICSVEDALSALEAGADILGIIFAPSSKRLITIEVAQQIIQAIRAIQKECEPSSSSSQAPLESIVDACDTKTLICGVFADQSTEDVAKIVSSVSLDIIQFSGASDTMYIPERNPPLFCFKATHVRDDTVINFEADSTLKNSSNAFMLLDSFDPAVGGGTGRVFDWKRLASMRLPSMFALAGGLQPDNVSRAVDTLHPFIIDVCSGVEAKARIKNKEKMGLFSRNAYAAALKRPNIKTVINALVDGGRPTPYEVSSCIAASVFGPATSAQLSSLLTALSLRLDVLHDPQVLIRSRNVLLSQACNLKIPQGFRTLDIVGTGGDGSDTFNVSTAAALVVGAVARSQGVKDLLITKHGNRSSAGPCGSADFIEAQGAVALTVAGSQSMLDSTNFAFLFAPAFHPAMSAVRQVRREIGIRTIFNLLGPLINPVQPNLMVLGVSKRALGPVFAAILSSLPEIQSALVVYSSNGWDEIAPFGTTMFWRVEKQKVTEFVTTPADFGLSEFPAEAVLGGSPAENVARWRRLIQGGEKSEDEALEAFVSATAGAALWIAGVATDLKSSVEMAQRAIRSGVVGEFVNNVFQN